MNNKDHLVGQLTSENLARATDPLSMTALLILLLALIMLIGQEAVIMLIRQGIYNQVQGLTGAPDPTGRCHLQGPRALS